MKKIILLVSILMLSAALPVAGSTGLAFLKIGVDARSAGMGEAAAAVVSDASAVYWNPAGLVKANRSGVLFSHNQWIEGVRGEFAALSFKRKKSAWAVHVQSVNLGDIELRTGPTSQPLELTTAHYLSAGLSYARQLGGRLTAGATLKYLFEKIDIESATGYAADLGIGYRLPFGGMRAGLAVQNIGKMNRLLKEESRLPILLRAGLGKIFPALLTNISALVAIDVLKPREEDLRWHLGSELLIWNQLALRGGFLAGYESRSFSFGLGINRSGLRIDYALTPFSDDLGSGHRVSLLLAL